MKKYGLFVLLLPLLLGGWKGSTESVLKEVLRLPDARKVYERVVAQGAVGIEWRKFGGPSTAMWDGGRRVIVLNSGRNESFGQRITSVVFELHNALSTERFARLDRLAWQGKLTKVQYIEAVERVEHDNALKVSRLIAKGIQKGVYPPDAYWPIAQDFQDHFAVQRRAGHSAQIGTNYECLCH